jgi:acylphosphatase
LADLASFKALIHGRVQGVSFRYFIRKEAIALQINGWVRNVPGGMDLQVEAEGPRESLEKLVGIMKIGPPAARVENVNIEWEDYTGKYSDFRIRF